MANLWSSAQLPEHSLILSKSLVRHAMRALSHLSLAIPLALLCAGKVIAITPSPAPRSSYVYACLMYGNPRQGIDTLSQAALAEFLALAATTAHPEYLKVTIWQSRPDPLDRQIVTLIGGPDKRYMQEMRRLLGQPFMSMAAKASNAWYRYRIGTAHPQCDVRLELVIPHPDARKICDRPERLCVRECAEGRCESKDVLPPSSY